MKKAKFETSSGRRVFIQRAAAGASVLSTAGLVYANDDLPMQDEVRQSGLAGDIYDVLRESILIGAFAVPVIGGFLSFLGASFIPSSGESPEQMWNRLMRARISDALLRLAQRDLVGLSEVSRLYKIAIESGNSDEIRAQSIAANTQFTAMVPGFQVRGEEAALLPLFAIAATLHLALLRDMVLKGRDIGLSDGLVARYTSEMVVLIRRYTIYVDTHASSTIDKARRDNPNSTVGLAQNMPLSAMLIEKTKYQLTVLDLRDTWANLDPIRYPGKSRIKLDREIFTPVIGWLGRKNSRPDVIPVWRRPSSPLSSLEVWDRMQWRTRFIFGFDAMYEDGSVMSSGSRISNSHNVRVGKYINRVTAEATAGVYQMRFRSNDGRWTKVGRDADDDTPIRRFDSSYSGHRLSSIRHVGIGMGAAEGAVRGCVLGFQLIHPSGAPMSREALNSMAPKIAPQVLKWLEDEAIPNHGLI